MRFDAQGCADTITARIKDYESQLSAYTQQVEALKKELEDQKQSYRAQVAAQEQRAHESWVSFQLALDEQIVIPLFRIFSKQNFMSESGYCFQIFH